MRSETKSEYVAIKFVLFPFKSELRFAFAFKLEMCQIHAHSSSRKDPLKTKSKWIDRYTTSHLITFDSYLLLFGVTWYKDGFPLSKVVFERLHSPWRTYALHMQKTSDFARENLNRRNLL